MEHGVRRVEVQVKGPARAARPPCASIQNTGIEVSAIKDVTPVPHNGCRRRSGGGSDMARYTGPVCGSPPGRTNSTRERQGPQGHGAPALPAGRPRPHPPPQRQRVPHAAAEKQKAEVIYGVLERQFRNLRGGHRQSGVTGENLLRLLEQPPRQRGVPRRLGLHRPQARQFVNHGHVTVERHAVTIPSYRVRKGDVVSLVPKAQRMIVIRTTSTTLDRSRRAGSRPATAASRSPSATCPARPHRRARA
jgi:small subunit ribosomal protein S4